MGEKTKASILTLVFSMINSVFSIVFSLIYNNLLIRTYGSKLNGLIATLTQFVSLFSVIEGGFTTAAIVATYSPIVNKDYDRLNSILYTVKRIFLRIGSIITVVVLLCGSIYLRFIESPISYIHTIILLIISVSATGVSLCFLSKYTVLLQGDNKEYIQVLFSMIARMVTWGLSILLILNYSNIIIVFSCNFINVILITLLTVLYERKKYEYITYTGIFDSSLVNGTKDVLFQKIANTIFTSTDLVLISACISLSYASVYAIYNQVFQAIFTLLTSLVQAPFNSFGHLYKEENGQEMFSALFDVYKHAVLIICTIILAITGCLITPFVRLYTTKINDFNYIYPSLAFLFFSQIFAQIINRPYGMILNATGNFRMQNLQCGLAAVTNLIISVAFIRWLGINSIILGSFVGTLIILVMNLIQVYKHILNKSLLRVGITIISNYGLAIVLIFLSMKLALTPSDVIEFILLTFIVGISVTAIVLGFNYIIDKYRTSEMLKLSKVIFRKIGKSM